MNVVRRGNTLYQVDDVDRFADAEARFPDWHVWVTTSAELNDWLNTPGTLVSPEIYRLQQQFRQGI